ncbi:unnamed protein product, partial [Mesorhabditis belari]|uniref:Bestrophin homolog n=1 Tax=Mesorhabditis belari TaxID=2138241 RepID=A0AAF3EYM5_9BILA
MTINYNLAVSTSKPWTLFKLLLKWRGSIWKSVIVELVVWWCLYAVVSIIYRSALSPRQQRTFEKVVQYFDTRLDYIPLNFMLGFFVTVVVNRWTYLYQIIGFIDNVGLMVAEYVRGRAEISRMYRRNILRYCELAQVLVFRDISMRTRRRFPTLDTVVAAGFMLPHEKEKFDEIQYRYSKYWLPFQWALALTYDARKKGLIESDYYQVVITNEIKQFRTGLAWICNYDWVPIPIMYPQLVCLAVHTYFLVCVLARQYIISEHASNKTEVDLYFPIMSSLQFIFYMGWMKVAEAMLNPFGEDDDDFETNALIDRNITMGLMIVDQGYNRPPEIRRDPFWDEEFEPLYSEETARVPQPSLRGSASQIRLPEHVQEIRMVSLLDDPASPTLRRRVSVVPVNRHEDNIRASRRSSVSAAEVLGSIKKKMEKSFSRTRLGSESDTLPPPGKSVSSTNLDTMENQKKNVLTTQNSLPSAVYTVEEDEIDSPEKPPKRSQSGANLTASKAFAHHILDNVIEEDEEEIIRKKSVMHARHLDALKEKFDNVQKETSSIPEETVETIEEKVEDDRKIEEDKGGGEMGEEGEEIREEGEEIREDGKEIHDGGENKKESSQQSQPPIPKERERSSEFYIGAASRSDDEH